MPPFRSLRGTAIIAAALTLAACGSDSAAGPTTANNAQIIADMQDAYADASDSSQTTRAMLLDFSMTALTVGSPVTSGSVVIDGKAYPFSFTSFSVEIDGDTGIVNTVTLVTGWRHSNGDSLVALVYAPDGSGLYALGDAPDLGAAQLGEQPSLTLTDVARMVRGGTVSKAVAAGTFNLEVVAFATGDSYWGAELGSSGLHSGSISFAAAGGSCDEAGLGQLTFGDSLISCTMQRSSVAASADLERLDTDVVDPRALSVPEQPVTGVKIQTQMTVQ